jgi:hypothetical protein
MKSYRSSFELALVISLILYLDAKYFLLTN